MLEAAFWGVASAISLPLGAFIALRWRVRRRVLGLIMGFGAGAMISAVAFDLVQEAIEVVGTGRVAIGLAVGALTFFAGDVFIDRRGGKERKSVSGEQQEGNSKAIVLGTVLDGVPESIVIGGSLVVGGSVSVAIVAATFLSNLPESLAASVGLVRFGMSRGRLLGMWFGIVAISGLAAGLGYALLDTASPNLAAFFQTFAAGAMLTMLADTMMPEAYEDGGNPVGLFTVLGFVVALWLHTFD